MEERVFDDLRDTSVNASPLLTEAVVEDRRKQRVGEANRAVVALDHVRGDRSFERVCLNTCPHQKRLRRCAERRGQRKRLASGRGEPGDPCTHEIFERFGNRERLERTRVDGESARQLEREERISARALVDAEQCLTREVPAEAVVQ